MREYLDGEEKARAEKQNEPDGSLLNSKVSVIVINLNLTLTRFINLTRFIFV
jgi:hypothetical protein